MEQSAEILLKLLRIAISKESDYSLPQSVKWDEVIELALNQGVTPIASDGLQILFDLNPEVERSLDALSQKALRYEWLPETLVCEQDYDSQVQTISHLKDFYAQHGIKMMVLKGFGLSLNYPIPSHRPLGDIDTYNFGEWRKADDLVRTELGINIDASHEHHTVFMFEGLPVENHYDLINTKVTKSSAQIDNTLKSIIGDGFLPTATFNAIFLIRHMGQHIAGESISLRHLLDWGLFMEKHSNEIDWKFVIPYWQEIGISRFASAINSICVEHLGIDESHFHGQLSIDSKLKERILNDIISPEFDEECPSGPGVTVAAFKVRRFFANGWKRKLVYKESLLDSFVTGSFAKFRRTYINRSEI